VKVRLTTGSRPPPLFVVVVDVEVANVVGVGVAAPNVVFVVVVGFEMPSKPPTLDKSVLVPPPRLEVAVLTPPTTLETAVLAAPTTCDVRVLPAPTT